MFIPAWVSAWDAPHSAGVLLSNLAASRKNVTAFSAVYHVHIFSKTNTVNTPFVTEATETIFFRSPDRVRLNLTRLGREEVFLAAGRSTLVMVGDQAADVPWPQPFLLFRLLLDSDPDRLEQLLARSGFNLQVMSSNPSGEIIVLGGSWNQDNVPQVWYEASRNIVVRLILPPGMNQPGYNIFLSEYESHSEGLMWPGRIAVRSDGLPNMVLTLKSVTINPRLEKNPLNLDEIRRVEPPPPPQKRTSNPEIDNIRRMMEWLERKLQ
jgi:hypothetical protein